MGFFNHLKILFISVLFFACGGQSSPSSLTRAHIQSLLKNPSSGDLRLREGRIQGYVSVPAKGFIQRIMVGSRATGENCSVEVRSGNPGNKITVSFLGSSFYDLVELKPYPLFAAEIGGREVLIVQHSNNQVVSVTQTFYSEGGRIHYPGGSYIRECILLE